MPSLLAREEVAAFNAGVRSGDWTALVSLFADDEIVLLEGGPRNAWSREPERAAGELHLEERDGAIVRLRVLYEQFS